MVNVRRWAKKYRSKSKNPYTSRALTKRIKQVVEGEVEKKYVAIDTLNSPLVQVGTSIGISNLSLGSGNTQRIADVVKWKWISVKVRYVMDPAATGGAVVRMLIYFDKQANGAGAPNQVLFVTNTANQIFLTHRSPDTWPARFTLVADKTVALSMAGGSTNIPHQYEKEYKFRLNAKTHYFNGANAGTVADVSSNALTVEFYGSEIAPLPTVSFSILAEYEDA